MPRFSRDGSHVVMGTSVLSVDNKAVATTLTAGNPQPLDERNGGHFIAQAFFEGRYQLLVFDYAGNAVSIASEQGQNEMAAGGGIWAAWLAGDGYRDAHGTRDPSWGVMAVDDASGLVAVCTDRQNGVGLSVWDGETMVEVTTRPLGGGEACFRDGFLSYRDATGALVVWGGVGTNPPVPRDVPVSGVRFDGQWRLSYLNGVGLVVHEWSATHGLVVSGREDDFNADIHDFGTGRVDVAASATQGEAPGDLRRYVCDVVAQTVNGQPARLVKLTPDIDPPEPEEPVHGLFIEEMLLPDGTTEIVNKWIYVSTTPDGDPNEDGSWPLRYSSNWRDECEVTVVAFNGVEHQDVQFQRAGRRLSSGLTANLETRSLTGNPGLWEQFGVRRKTEDNTRGLVYRVESIHRDPTPHRVRSVAITLRQKP